MATPPGPTPDGGTPVAPRLRARDLGVAPGVFRPGKLNALTDVSGVRVGHATLVTGDDVRTGVTAILLTNTLSTWRVADALVDWMLEQPGMGDVRSLNPLVGETNDGRLNAIRKRAVGAREVRAALAAASTGPVAEGSIGAGTGTVAFGWKGGIGTSSRVLPRALGGWTVGVLVQSNYGGVLQVQGAPVGQALGQYAFRNEVEGERGDGSVVIVVATDAPMLHRNLLRLAERAIGGLARTGANMSNGSGDYVVAFSTAPAVRHAWDAKTLPGGELGNDAATPLFQAVADATEEALYNALFMATDVTGNGTTVQALPLAQVREVLERHGIRGGAR